MTQDLSGVTSAEELAEKYQKLFSEYSRIKAQQSILKKAVIKEQADNASLKEERRSKEQELRSSLEQLDLLTLHNQRLTRRIESLQDSSGSRISSGWFLGSAKKELEQLKSNLEAATVELQRKIEENEFMRSQHASEEAINVLGREKHELHNEVDKIRAELNM
ncbi:2423_t:CDS:2 [Entrophospora sp. SA101]|nr:2423_t:CDS:2 [Entrophospora sp. SA101]